MWDGSGAFRVWLVASEGRPLANRVGAYLLVLKLVIDFVDGLQLCIQALYLDLVCLALR